MAMAYEGKSPSPGDAKSGREYASLVGQKAEHVVLPPSAPRKVYWVDLNRFDQKTDKSTWIEMARAMSRCGYDVTVLSGCSEAARREGAYQGSEVKCFPAVDYPLLFKFTLMRNIGNWLLRAATRDDIVILAPAALYLAPVLRRNGIMNIHLDVRTLPVEIRGIKGGLVRLLFWRIPMMLWRRTAKGYSFITGRLKREVEREFDTAFDSSTIWTSGVNTERFAPRRVEDFRPEEARKFTLFYHGTVTANRGIDRVILALASLAEDIRRHMRFVIVGAGAAVDSLRKLAHDCGVGDVVVFKGLVPYEAVPAEIAKADCCVCPLPDRLEWNVSSPLKVFEYLASGKPIILTPIPAHMDVVGEEDFIVWTKGDDSADFAWAIQEAFHRRKELAAAALQGRRVAQERFDWRSIGRGFASYLDRVYRMS